MKKLEVVSCESCGQEFGDNSVLLRHVSHKEQCKDFYGEQRLFQMRRNGRLMAKKKWKQSLKYEKSPKGTNSKSLDEKPKKRNERNNGPYYPYIPEGVRQYTIEGRVFCSIFKIIYDKKKLAALEEFQEFALPSVFKRCVDVTLDEVLNEANLLDYEKLYSRLYENRRHWEGFMNYIYLPHYTSDDFIIANLERELESRYNFRLKNKKPEEEKKLIEYATLHLSRKCFKLCENTAFNHFFGKFKDMFPVIEREENISDVQLLCRKRHEEKDVEDFASEYLRSEPAKKLEEKLDSKILEQITYLKESLQFYLNDIT